MLIIQHLNKIIIIDRKLISVDNKSSIQKGLHHMVKSVPIMQLVMQNF